MDSFHTPAAKVQCTDNVVFSPSIKSKVEWELEINDVLYGRARFTNTLSFLVLIQNSCRCHAPLNWLYLKERRRIDEGEAESFKGERVNSVGKEINVRRGNKVIFE